jgi:TM2 domain-containing membrane protein YozV
MEVSTTPFCDQCGNEVSADAQYCLSCGRKRQVSIKSPAPPLVSPAPPAPPVITESKNTGIAALLAFFLPGIGHIYVGRIASGLVILAAYYILMILAIVSFSLGFFTLGVGFIFAILLGIGILAVWAWQLFNAYKLAKQFNAHVQQYGRAPW